MSAYPLGADVRRAARISDDGLYRYSLVRRWGRGGRPATFIMLNPSTADAELDDPTIRRCVGFAQRLECAGIVVVNLYAFRATKPADLWRAVDPVGPLADRFLVDAAERAARLSAPLIAAWGANAKRDRVTAVADMIAATGADLTAFGVTKAGAPRHPLYLRSDADLKTWKGDNA